MATLDSLAQPGVSAEVDATFDSLRVALKPLEYQARSGASVTRVLGSYRAAGFTSAILPSANAVLANLRWADPTSYLVLLRASVTLAVATAVTAQRLDPLSLTIARSYSASETTNATALTISGNNQKNRTNMGSSLITQLAVASAAAGISGGTKTLDSNPTGLASLSGPSAIAGLGTGLPTTDLYYYDKVGEHPIVLGLNEGLVVSWGATALATGTVVAGVIWEWAEVPAF